MRNRILPALGLTLLLLPAGAAGAPATPNPPVEPPAALLQNPNPPKWEDRSSPGPATGLRFEAATLRQRVADLPPRASVDQLELALFELLPQVFRATNRDLPVVAEMVVSLSRQPGAVEAMVRQYRQLAPDSVEQRLMVLGILGELRRPDAVAPLVDVVWAPLPPAESQNEKLTARDLEEMIQVKAVQGLAYLGTPEADAKVREVMKNHEALHVRVSAIDAYLWNHGDRPETAAELYRQLPAELHPFIARPRFHRGMDRAEFARRLAAWQRRWGSEPHSPPAPGHESHGGEP